jgi:hypothetical protein
MPQRPARGAVGDDAVHHLQGVLIDGDHALGVQLAQRDLDPGAVAGNLVHAVQLQVQQLPDAHPGRTGQQQRVGA